jgi:hypothetical protein
VYPVVLEGRLHVTSLSHPEKAKTPSAELHVFVIPVVASVYPAAQVIVHWLTVLLLIPVLHELVSYPVFVEAKVHA